DPADRALVNPASSGERLLAEGATASRTRRQAQHGDSTARAALTLDSAYYSARDLDVYPLLLAPLALHYPERALAENRAGRARVVVMIDAAGKVQKVSVEESDPPGYFEEAARKTLEAAVFSAARRRGLPVGSRVVINLDFDPAAATNAP
ncbi:MAG: energy transducer TonB, partial [Rhodospirillaceae bacterium]